PGTKPVWPPRQPAAEYERKSVEEGQAVDTTVARWRAHPRIDPIVLTSGSNAAHTCGVRPATFFIIAVAPRGQPRASPAREAATARPRDRNEPEVDPERDVLEHVPLIVSTTVDELPSHRCCEVADGPRFNSPYSGGLVAD